MVHILFKLRREGRGKEELLLLLLLLLLFYLLTK